MIPTFFVIFIIPTLVAEFFIILLYLITATFYGNAITEEICNDELSLFLGTIQTIDSMVTHSPNSTQLLQRVLACNTFWCYLDHTPIQQFRLISRIIYKAKFMLIIFVSIWLIFHYKCHLYVICICLFSLHFCQQLITVLCIHFFHIVWLRAE